MFVSRSMSRKVATVDKETGLIEAWNMMRKQKIRHLPVVDDANHLLGMITDRDVRSALPYDLAKSGADPQKVEEYAHLQGVRCHDHQLADRFAQSHAAGCDFADRT